MKKLVLMLLGAGLGLSSRAQQTEVLSGDSIRLTGSSGATTLIIENQSQQKKGFLFNHGNGRTAFASLLTKINDSTYCIGIDTIRLAIARAVLLNRMDTIRGVKTFNPVMEASSDTMAGTVFNSSFLATTNKDTMVGVNVAKAQVVGPGPLRIPYSARFFDKIIFQGDVNFYRNAAFVKNGVFYSNNWIRATNDPAMRLAKPANASPVQLVIQPTRASKNLYVKAGTLLKDSVFFTEGVQDYSFIKNTPVLSQQNGASGPLRAFYVTPELTGVSGFRGMQVDLEASAGHALYATGTAPSQFGGVVQYLANYSNTFTARSLADKAYTDSIVGGQWFLGSNHSMYRTGNVAIDQKANAGYLAAINGTVMANKGTVSNSGVSWPDYVFDTAYSLKPLREVEQYVTRYKHLPGMPSAATIQKEGIDVADMQAALLKQVEELTLRLLNQHDQLKQQAKKIAALEQQL